MQKYIAHSSVTISVYTIIEAKSKEDASEIAHERSTESLCPSGQSDDSKEWTFVLSAESEEIDDVEIEKV